MQHQCDGVVARVLDRDEELAGRRPVPNPLSWLQQQCGLLFFREHDAQLLSIARHDRRIYRLYGNIGVLCGAAACGNQQHQLQREEPAPRSASGYDTISILSEILQMNPKPASMFAFSRPTCKTDARC